MCPSAGAVRPLRVTRSMPPEVPLVPVVGPRGRCALGPRREAVPGPGLATVEGEDDMDRTRKVGVTAALVGGTGWVGKILIMAVQRGPDAQSVPEAIAFFAGLAGVIVASASLGFYLTRTRPAALRALAAFGAVLATAVVVGIGQAGLSGLGEGWIFEEAIFGVAGIVALLVATRSLLRPADHGAVAP